MFNIVEGQIDREASKRIDRISDENLRLVLRNIYAYAKNELKKAGYFNLSALTVLTKLF